MQCQYFFLQTKISELKLEVHIPIFYYLYINVDRWNWTIQQAWTFMGPYFLIRLCMSLYIHLSYVAVCVKLIKRINTNRKKSIIIGVNLLLLKDNMAKHVGSLVTVNNYNFRPGRFTDSALLWGSTETCFTLLFWCIFTIKQLDLRDIYSVSISMR